MNPSDLIIKLGARWTGDAAVKKAEKSVKNLSRSVLRLTVGGTGAAGFALFAKRSIGAFLDSERAAKSLNSALSSLGVAYQQEAASKYIDKLSLQYGIIDEQLNPALQTLVLNTRDLTKAQSLLTTAIDTSAGTGIDLQSVVDALGKAYNGNRTALVKLNIGISAASAKSANFNDIITALNDQFSGQAAIAADTYSGKIDRMSIAVDKLQESFGRGLVQGLADTNDSLNTTIRNMEILGTVGGEAMRAIMSPLTVVSQLLQKDTWTKFADQFGNKPTDLVNTGGDRGGKAKAAEEKYNSQIKKQQESMTRLQKQQVNLQKASLAEQKKQAMLKKGSNLLDIEQIQILAALQGQLSDNEKLRLQLQFALITGNAAEADRLSNELARSQLLTTGLATAIANLPPALNPFKEFPNYINDLLRQLALLQDAMNKLKLPDFTQQVSGGVLTASAAAFGFQTNTAYQAFRAGERASYSPDVNVGFNNQGMPITVQVQLDGRTIAESTTDYQLNNSMSGSFASIGSNGRVRDY